MALMTRAPWSSGVGAFVLIIVAVISCVALRPASPWVDVDLYVPASFKPWVHNGTRLAVATTWSATQLDVNLHVPRDYEKVFQIKDFNRAAIVASAVHSSPNVIMLLEDIQKSSYIFNLVSMSALLLTFISAVLLLLITGSRVFCTHGCRPQLSSATIFRAGVAFQRFKVKRPVFEGIRQLPYLLGALSAICALAAGLFYAVTLQIDVKVLLPSIVRDLQLLCISHGPHSCSVVYRVRIGTILFVAANLVQFACTLVIPLVFDTHYKLSDAWAEVDASAADSEQHSRIARALLLSRSTSH